MENPRVTASGGFTNYSDDQLRDQVRSWTDEGDAFARPAPASADAFRDSLPEQTTPESTHLATSVSLIRHEQW